GRGDLCEIPKVQSANLLLTALLPEKMQTENDGYGKKSKQPPGMQKGHSVTIPALCSVRQTSSSGGRSVTVASAPPRCRNRSATSFCNAVSRRRYCAMVSA